MRYEDMTNAERFVDNQRTIAEAGGLGFRLIDDIRENPDSTINDLTDGIVEEETGNCWSWKDMGDIVRDHYERCSAVFAHEVQYGEFSDFNDFLTTCLALDCSNELLEVRDNVIDIIAGHELFMLYLADCPIAEDLDADVCNDLKKALRVVDGSFTFNAIKALVLDFYVKRKLKED